MGDSEVAGRLWHGVLFGVQPSQRGADEQCASRNGHSFAGVEMTGTEMIWITRTSCLRTRRGMSMRRWICLFEHVCGRKRGGEVLLESGSDG